MKKVIFQSKCLQVAFFVLFTFFFLCFSPQLSYSTAPKSVELTYDLNMQTLSVKIEHNSLAPKSHYIESVEIKKNGVVISKEKYDTQPTDSVFTYTYKIQAAKADIIEVTATCNLWGHKTSTLTVP
jgi:desulfoferrodoxin (superoxide reductase-like protein)